MTGWHSKQALPPDLSLIDPQLADARIAAAAEYEPDSIPSRAILSGQWDGGSVVGRHLRGGE
jgi:hypothetical protein